MSFPKRSELLKPVPNGSSCYVEISIDRGKRKGVGFIIAILTNSETHPHGIKVKINTGEVGRVIRLLSKEEIVRLNMKYKKNMVEMLGGKMPDETTTDEETPDVEYKETFSLDVQEAELRAQGKIEAADGRKNSGKLKDIKKEVAIAASAFSNTSTGILEIGKTDDGKISGYFKHDLEQFKNWDQYTNAIIDSIKSATNDTIFANSIEILNSPGQKDYLRLKIPKGKNPIFIHDNTEEFYIRSKAAAKSQKLSPSETHKYLKEYFPNY